MSTAILPQNALEEEWIARVSEGDLDAFNHLVEEYQDLAYHHAWTFLKEQDLAEDATQESFIKAYLSIGSFRGGSFRAWLLRIVANTSYDVLRKQKRRKLIPLFPEHEDGSLNDSPKWLVDSSPSVEETIEMKEGGLEIYRLLDELPDIYRLVLILIDIYEFDYKETAQTLNIKVGTVKSRIRRARLKMREKLMNNSSFNLPRKYSAVSQLAPITNC